MDINFKVIPKLKPIYAALQRYIVMYGGRGGGKSFETARLIIIRMIMSDYPMRILCCREIQKSIKESVYILLVQAIYDLGLQDEFEILSSTIRSKRIYDRGLKSEVFFNGIKNNIYEIKSMANVDICWVEEAANVSQESWDILLPTIRKEGSQMILTFNPTEMDAPTHKMFVTTDIPESERLLININYWDNPFISDTLLKEMERMKAADYERYLHHWEGQPLTLSNAVIFKGKFRVAELEEEYFISQKSIFYKGKLVQYKYGMDFGFSTDPFACVECFMQDGKIYITRELYWHGMENVDIIPMLEKTMPELVTERRRVYADSAYPATISQLSKIQIHPTGTRLEPLNIQPAVKGKGSVEEGINWLKGFEIIVDPKCKNMIYELSNYKYKTDKDTGEIIPLPEDKNNHLIDSLRYSFNEEIVALRGGQVRAIIYNREHERRKSPIWN